MAEPDRAARGDAVSTHTAASAGAPGGDRQLDMLTAQGDAARDRLMPVPEAAKSRPAPTGAGRPPGSRNRRMEELASYLTRRYGDPLEADVALGMMDVRTLIPELRAIASDCGIKVDMSLRDVLQLQADARYRSLKYLYAPRAAETSDGKAVDLPVIGLGAVQQVHVHVHGGASVEDKIEAMKTVDVKIEPNQRDSDDDGR